MTGLHISASARCCSFALLCSPVTLLATDGHFLHGAGPVNEAMGGADTGMCLDATGSIAWNPACAARFSGRRFEFHGTIFTPWRSLSSTVDANAFGPGMPGATLSGTTVSKRDMSLMPGFAFIYHRLGSANAYHVGDARGERVRRGLRPEHRLLQSDPDAAGAKRFRIRPHPVELHAGDDSHGCFAATERTVSAVGFSAVPSLSMLQVIPAPFAPPVTGGSTMPYYLSAGNNAPAFGAGFNAGVHYAFETVSLGVSYRSPVWFQQIQLESQGP